MVKITGYITLIGASILSILCSIEILKRYEYWYYEDWIYFLILITSLSAIYYTLKTRFWTKKPNLIMELNKENEIIRKKIEKMELLKKLENFENK